MKKDKKKLNLDAGSMSRSELEELSRFAAKELAKRDEEEARKKKIKSEYRIEPFEYRWKINYCAFYEKVCESVASGVPVDETVLEKILERSFEAEPLDYSKIYRCPECGELHTLYPGIYEGRSCDISRYAIACSNCSFNLSNEPYSTEWAAWETFHHWLISNGYLDKDVKQPVKSPRKW